MASLVSIVLATYNGSKFLRQQLDSILNQSYDNFELIVVDDGSTDDTLSILKDYSDQDSRIKVYPAEMNLGVVANFERGLRLAKGEFIALSDQDDIFREEKIDLLTSKLIKNPKCDLVISDLSLIDSDGNELFTSMWKYQRLNPRSGKPFRRLVYSNFATGCAMMFRRRLLNLAVPIPAGVLVHDWWIAVVATSKNAGGICLLNESLTSYRQHDANVIGAKSVYVFKMPSIKKLLEFIKSSSRIDFKGVRIRLRDSVTHSGRLKSYLQRDIWTEYDRKVISQTIKLFEGYTSEDNKFFLKRILMMPLRLRYALLTRRLTPLVSVLYFTFFPNIKKL